MRIVLFSENRANYWSGGRWYPHLIAHALASKGHRVIIATNILPVFDEYFKDFPGRENIKIIIDPKNQFALNKEGLDTHYRGKFDVAIGSPIRGALYASTFAELKRCKSMVLCYEPNNWIKEKSGRDDILLPGQRWNEYMEGAKKCDKFLCNAELPAEYAKRWIPEISEKVDFLFNGYNSFAANRIKVKEPGERKDQIVFVSRTYRSKGFTDIADCLKDLRNKPKVIFITGGGEKDAEKRLIDDCKKADVELDIKKLVSDEEKFKILADSKALFFPSRWEGFGIPPAEAFSVQTPVICYNLPILKEIYRNYPHYMKLGRPKFNKKLLNSLFEDNTVLFKNIESARDHVVSFGDFNNFADILERKVNDLFTTKELESTNVVARKIANVNRKKVTEFSKANRKAKFSSNKKISLIIPYYNGDLKFLSQCAQSIDRQTHKNYEVIFVNDGTTDATCKKAIEAIRNVGDWIIIDHDKNKGIPQSITTGVKKASGEIIAFLDADDMLRDRALERIAHAFEQEEIQFAYTNEVQINAQDEIIFEEKKPDWSMECLYTGQYINHLTAFEAKFLKSLMPCKKEYGGSWDYDLLLRAAEKNPKVIHIAQTLYNWRIHKEQAGGMGRQYTAQEDALTALEHHFERIGLNGKKKIVQTPVLGYFDSRHSYVGEKKPKILVITMTRNVHYLGQLIISMEKGTHIDYDHLIVHHEPQGRWDKDLLNYFRSKDLWFELISGPFNFAKAHNDMIAKHGEDYDYFVLLNDDIIVNNHWLTELIAIFHYKWDKIGVVGCKLMYPNNDDLRHNKLPTFWYDNVAKIQHAGVCLLRDRGAAHCYVNKPCNIRSVNFIRPFETVTFGLVAIDAKCYNEIKMNPKYDSDLNDMDFCIRAKKKGWRIIYTPWANAIHLCSVTRRKYGIAGKKVNQVTFRKEYKAEIKGKPNYRQMLDKEDAGWL